METSIVKLRFEINSWLRYGHLIPQIKVFKEENRIVINDSKSISCDSVLKLKVVSDIVVTSLLSKGTFGHIMDLILMDSLLYSFIKKGRCDDSSNSSTAQHRVLSSKVSIVSSKVLS